MAEEEPKEETASPDEPSAGVPSPPDAERHRKMRLTPEQRRFLGTPRSLHDPGMTEEKPAKIQSTEKAKIAPPESSRPQRQETPRRARGWRLSRAVEMQNVALIFGALVLLAATFYVGKKFEYWKYLIASRKQAKIAARVTNQFPGSSSEELVEQAMVDERLGNWEQAAKRLVAAKYKNLSLPGVLFRASKLYYDHGDFNSADQLFDSAIAFGENVDASNYFRGMIASGRSDFPAAERFFEAAANAAPFNADYCYSLAETLRKDHRPKDAIARYEQAARRGATDEERTICRFKARMAAVEAADTGPVSSELEQKQSAGPLSVDWLMTSAALEIQQGHISNAVQVIERARDADQSRLFALFAACVSDRLFTNASQENQELAQACRVENRKTSSAQPHDSVKPGPP
jgi:tetratricopeptide (TPR) repeat protein